MSAQPALTEPFSLAHTELFHGLDDRRASAVASAGRVRVLRAGQEIFRAGEPACSMFVVREGAVRLSVPVTVLGESRDVRLEIAAANATLGWCALSPPYVYASSARAIEPSVLLAFSREQLQALMDADPGLDRVLRSNAIRMLSERLQQMQALWIRQVQREIAANAR